ncbi:hypothetical protein SBA2_300020 [Acidobacteriia bacterium SbA2]|nr:hypothetical protein SBA2_300020 [Acidobacteriia bacterium SbA2]
MGEPTGTWEEAVSVFVKAKFDLSLNPNGIVPEKRYCFIGNACQTPFRPRSQTPRSLALADLRNSRSQELRA